MNMMPDNDMRAGIDFATGNQEFSVVIGNRKTMIVDKVYTCYQSKDIWNEISWISDVLHKENVWWLCFEYSSPLMRGSFHDIVISHQKLEYLCDHYKDIHSKYLFVNKKNVRTFSEDYVDIFNITMDLIKSKTLSIRDASLIRALNDVECSINKNNGKMILKYHGQDGHVLRSGLLCIQSLTGNIEPDKHLIIS